MKQEMMQWHYMNHMQIIRTSLQTGNHTSISSLDFYRPDAQPTKHSRHRHKIPL